MLIRILNTLRSRIWDMVLFLFSDYLNLRFNNMECARRLWSSGKLNSKGLTLKLLSFQHKSLICYLSQLTLGRMECLAQRNKIKLITILLFFRRLLQFNSISSTKAASVSPANYYFPIYRSTSLSPACLRIASYTGWHFSCICFQVFWSTSTICIPSSSRTF